MCRLPEAGRGEPAFECRVEVKSSRDEAATGYRNPAGAAALCRGRQPPDVLIDFFPPNCWLASLANSSAGSAGMGPIPGAFHPRQDAAAPQGLFIASRCGVD